MKSLTVSNLSTLPFGPEEALNRLRVNLNFCGDQYRTIIVTSSTPEEGKSFVTANLWRMLAESGKNVVLIDADLRKSVLRRRYKIKSDDKTGIGLSHYLSGQANLVDVVYQTNIPNAYMIPVFHTVTNPAILLQGNRFTTMLESLKKSFDYILIDTPPLGSVADAEMIASYCDGAVLVVRGSFTPRKLIDASLKQIERADCQLLGVVLNRVEQKKNAYYYKYSKYGYYYASNDNDKSTKIDKTADSSEIVL